MSATIIQGYGVETQKLDLEITRKTARVLESNHRPIQVGSSAPVIEFLAERMDWEAVESCVRKQKSTFPDFKDESAMGLVIHDLDHPELGVIAFPLHEKGDVTPAVILKLSVSAKDAEDPRSRRSVWDAEACVVKTEFLASSGTVRSLPRHTRVSQLHQPALREGFRRRQPAEGTVRGSGHPSSRRLYPLRREMRPAWRLYAHH